MAEANTPYAIRAYAPERLREALRKMYLIRKFEEGAEDCYMRGQIHGTMHLSIGQEASAVGSCMSLGASDRITSTHRGHGHCVAKNADLRRMFAEFFGKETGYCRGRGGSMHIADVEGGNLGANGIVGGGLPLAVGSALAAQRLATGAVTVCFFGDGASNEGAFHESLNMASLWSLPVVFVCENNGYGMSNPTGQSTSVQRIADRAAAYSMPGSSVDGNDFSAVTEAVDGAVARARAGDGPSLVENLTYRWRGHSRSDRNRYRSREEIAAWMERDPIPRLADLLVAHGILTGDGVARLEAAAAAVIRDAMEYAAASPEPLVEEATRYVYAGADGS